MVKNTVRHNVIKFGCLMLVQFSIEPDKGKNNGKYI